MLKKQKNNYSLYIIVICQILILIFCIITSFGPRDMVTLQSEDFNQKEFKLKSGAYTVSVYYDSLMNTVSDTKNVRDIVGSISFESFACPAALRAGTMLLNDAETCKQQTIWISYGAKLEDIRAHVQYNDSGVLNIEKIVIQESLIYRVTRLLGIIILFAVFDIIYSILVMGYFKNISVLLVILFASSILLISNTTYYGHDLDFHLNRIVSIANGITQGQFPVRMHSDMLNGYGYPTSLFYGDTLLYIPAILYLMKVPLGMCFYIYILINNILTVVFGYMCFKTITDNRICAVMGTLTYTLAPYRLTNIYTRAAVGEFTAMSFFPLIILGLWNIYTKEKWTVKDYLPFIIGASGIIQCHVISTEMTVIFVFLFCVLLWKKTFDVKRLFVLLKSAVAIILLNLWFIIPMLDSMSMDLKSFEVVSKIQEQGLYPIQWFSIFYSGVGMALKNTVQNEMGFSIGSSLCIGTATYIYLYMKQKNNQSFTSIQKCAGICMKLGIIAVILTSRFFPWDILASRSKIFAKYFCMIQYPWRYLSVATILLTVVSVCVLSQIENKENLYKLMGIILLFTVISTGYYYYNFTFESNAYQILSENELNRFYIGNEEYLLSETDVSKMYTRSIIYDDNMDIEVSELKTKNGEYAFLCNNNENREVDVTFPVLHYEHYKVTDNITGMELNVDNGDNNCIKVSLPANYNGKVSIKYQEPEIWRISEVLSLTTVVYLLISYIIQRKKQVINA